MKKAAIKIQNCYSWLTTNCDDIMLDLWRALRHREKGYFHSRLYKQRLWDGYTEFFKKESGRFLTGLLPEVTAALDHWKVPYKLHDERAESKFLYSQIGDDFLDQWLHHLPKEDQDRWEGLRDYQVDLANQVIKYKRGVVFAPTSAGKTAIMVAILKTVPKNMPTLILANKKSLCDQNYDALKSWGFEDVGRLYDKYKDPNIFTCATVQSLHKIETLLPKIRVMIVDEIHDMMSKVPKKFYLKMKDCSVRVAVSATPFKFGGKDKTQKFSVKGHFGPVLKTKSADNEKGILTTKTLQDRGILSACNCTFYPINEPQIPWDIYLDAVTNGIAESWHFHEVVTNLAKSLKGRTLILVERLAHGDALENMIPGAIWVRGKDNLKTRKEVISKLQRAKKDTVAIATQGIFNAGINVFVHNLINAAGGQADHQIIQRLGRGLRTASDKEILEYYDFVFDINEYLLDHSRKRIKILEKEGHSVTVKDGIDF